MSRYTYAGPWRNPTESWFVQEVSGKFEVWKRYERESDGSCKADAPFNPPKVFDCGEDAEEYISDIKEFFEEDYDDYLEENHYEIARMEAYEQFRNEY